MAARRSPPQQTKGHTSDVGMGCRIGARITYVWSVCAGLVALYPDVDMKERNLQCRHGLS